VSFEIEQFFYYVLCHSIILNAHVLGSKIQGKKRLISYKTKNGTSTMKRCYETQHSKNNLNTHKLKIQNSSTDPNWKLKT
jgi:hypothetical protein